MYALSLKKMQYSFSNYFLWDRLRVLWISNTSILAPNNYFFISVYNGWVYEFQDFHIFFISYNICSKNYEGMRDFFIFSHWIFFLDWISWRSIRAYCHCTSDTILAEWEKGIIHIFDKLWVYILWGNVFFFHIHQEGNPHLL